jgi:hypothetical protein
MRRGLAFVVAGLLVGHDAFGQRAATTTIDVNAIGLRYADSVSSGGVSISPTLSLSSARASFDVAGTLSKFGSGMSGQGVLALSGVSPSWHRLSVELATSAGGSSHEDGYSTGQGRASARLHFIRGSGGAWSGGGAGAMWDGFGWRRVREMEAGAWIGNGQTQLVVSATPTVVDDTIRYTDAQAAVGWSAPRAEIGFTAGIRSGSRLPSTPGDGKVWGGASIVVPMARQASFIAAAGTYPLDFTQGFPAGRYVTAGIRFSTGPGSTARPSVSSIPSSGIARFEVSRENAENILIRVRAPGAVSVDIMGDVTQWESLRLRVDEHDTRQFWVTLPAKSGTSQINIRVNDGPWTVPPGLTVVKDELGTEVGILVVPDR